MGSNHEASRFPSPSDQGAGKQTWLRKWPPTQEVEEEEQASVWLGSSSSQ